MSGNANDKSYSQELLEAAIDLVKSGKVSIKKASRDFNIPYSTLGEKLRGRRPVKASSRFLLFPGEERKLVKWVNMHAECAVPRSAEDLRMKVKEVLELRGASTKTKDGLPGKDWLLSFRRRFPDLNLTGQQVPSPKQELAPVSQDAVRETVDQNNSGEEGSKKVNRSFKTSHSTKEGKTRERRLVKAGSKFLHDPERERKLVEWVNNRAKQATQRSVADLQQKVKENLEIPEASAKTKDVLPGKDCLISFREQTPRQERAPATHNVVRAAVHLVKSGKMGLKKASRDFKIPYSTLGEKVRGRRPVKANSRFLLDPEEEQVLVEWVNIHNEQATPLSVGDLRRKVKEVLELRGASANTKDGLPGKDWLLAFRRRFPDLNLRRQQTLRQKRALVPQNVVRAAVHLVKSGKIGLAEASKNFKIPISTLSEKVRGRRPVVASSRCLLRPEEERKLMEWLHIHTEQAIPRSVKDLRWKVKEVLELRGASAKTKDGLPGKDWLRSFRRRFPDLSIETSEGSGKERILVVRSKAFLSQPVPEDDAPPPTPSSPSEESTAPAPLSHSQATGSPSSESDKWDTMCALLHLADKVGLDKSTSFLLAAKQNSPLEDTDQEFCQFQRLLLDLGVSPSPGITVATAPESSAPSSSHSLNAIPSTPRLPRNDGGETKKSTPLSCAFSSSESTQIPKQEESQKERKATANECNELERLIAEEAQTLERAKTKIREKDKEQRARLERKRKKKVKERKEDNKILKVSQKKSNAARDVSNSGGDCDVVLENDSQGAETKSVSTCRKCGGEYGESHCCVFGHLYVTY